MSYDSMTPQQQELYGAVCDLQVLLDDLIPTTTAHYAVEGVRSALVVLERESGKVITKDSPDA